MRLGLMQPYLFPYFEFFRLINDCDLWIHFDTVQFSRSSWQNRNRILDSNKGWSYLGVPVVRDGIQTTIRDARIDDKQDWRKGFLNKLRIYEKHAPHYEYVFKLVSGLISEQYGSLADFNIAAIESICQRLEIETPTQRLGEMSIAPPDSDTPGGWPLHICRQAGASEYRNASGGRALYEPDIFLKAGIELTFHQHIDFFYDTNPFTFVPDLSIIDALMWVDVETLKDLVHKSRPTGAESSPQLLAVVEKTN